MADSHAGHNTPNQFTRSLLELERDDPRHAKSIEHKMLSILKMRTGIASIQNDSRRHSASRLINGLDASIQKQVIQRQAPKVEDKEPSKDLER